MKFAYPEFDFIIDTDNRRYNTIIIENQKLMRRLLEDILAQIENEEGRCIVSRNDKPEALSKSVEIITDFLRFDINKKTLMNKIISVISSRAIEAEHYESTMMILNNIEKLLNDIVFDLDGNLGFPGITVAGLIKMASPMIIDDYDLVTEKIIDYMDLVTEYDRMKLFITVNMRSFVDDDEMQIFVDTVLRHGFNVIGIENKDNILLEKENRVIVDTDLCEISE